MTHNLKTEGPSSVLLL